ncbi:MAG: S8 family peptidase [Methanolobus sp.]|nr:S8 family peptidase [Methanolobus sp.]
MGTKVVYFAIILLVLLSIPGEAKFVIIGFEESINQTTIEEHNIINYTLHKKINAISTDISETSLHELKKEKSIRYIEDDITVHITKKVSQSIQEVDWGIDCVNAPQVWANSTGNSIKIAIIDTGISKKHPDLIVAGGVDLRDTTENKKWDDDNGHGTHVAGIIGACNNSIGVVGVAYDSELYAVKVLDNNGNGQISDVIEGIEWAMENDMDIISLSLGTNLYSQALEDACEVAYNSDILLVAAAGNSGDGDLTTNNVEYPAKFDSVIAVAAIDCNNVSPVWSADGTGVELAAPGVDIYSTYLEGGYFISSGTSMAAPFVSGVAALIKSENPSLSSEEIRNLLVYRAVDLGTIGKDSTFGYGLVQAS